MDLVNRVLLLPDGAAALAITGMREDGTPESSVSDDRASFRRNPCFDFYESLYRRHHLNGLHRVPGPIAGKRYKSHVDGSFAPQRRELPAFWWTPELLRRHRAAIERFKPDEPIPESVPAPEDDRDGRGD
jgi:hypothetical protein